MHKSNVYRYNQSSEEEDDSSDQEHIAPAFVKSAVFNHTQQPLIKSNSYENKRAELNHEVEDEESHLRPKLKVQQQPQKVSENKPNKFMENVSGLMSVKHNSISQANLHKKAVNAAYTFKIKSPNPMKKKNDPVALFHQTKTSWKKDKFLTSRTDLKQGRKLELQKRNQQYV